MNLTLHYSERVYNALLSLYPVRFRIRFAPEMLQLFRDCCHDALEKGEVAFLPHSGCERCVICFSPPYVSGSARSWAR